MTKKQQAELNRLRKEAGVIHQRISAIEASDRVAQGKTLVGKCFKYRNCYSCPEKPSDFWWSYTVVTAIDDHGWLTLLSFQSDKNGRVEIKTDVLMYSGYLPGYVEITTNELAGAWLDLGKHISKIGSELQRAL